MDAINAVSAANQAKIQASMSNLSSGYDRSKPSALLASRVSNEAKAASVGISNGALAHGRLDASNKALSQGQEIVGRIGELAARASDPSLSNDDRALLNIEANALNDELGNLLQNSQFNGQGILTGGSVDTSIDGKVSANDADGAAIVGNLAGLDLSTLAGAQNALTQVDDTRQALSEGQALVGAGQDRFARSSVAAANRAANLQQAAAEMANTNIAVEVGKLQKYMTQQKITQSVQAMKNDQLGALSEFFDD